MTSTKPSIVYADGAQSPRRSPAEIADFAGIDGPFDLRLGWTVERSAWLDDPELRGETYMAGYGLSQAVNEGRFVSLPVRLSAVPSLLAARPADVCVVTGVPRASGFAFTSSVGWGDSAALGARLVIVEVDEDAQDVGAPMIVGNIVGALPRPEGLPSSLTVPRPADDIDVRIGEFVVSLIPEDSTLQFGPGGIGEGIASALDRPVQIWSGLLTDAMAGLAGRGLLVGKATAAYGWGGEAIRNLADSGLVQYRPVSFTHDLTRVSAIPRFVGCNTALQVGLDGSVNVERVAGRIVSSIGGHADFCAAASRSPGGISIIALRSTNRRGESTIVAHVEVVSTARSDIQVVVTEHGIADLRGVGDTERARRLVAVAAPQHRDALAIILESSNFLSRPPSVDQ